jgi:hypothetical protein
VRKPVGPHHNRVVVDVERRSAPCVMRRLIFSLASRMYPQIGNTALTT